MEINDVAKVDAPHRRKILVLHGNRQTGELLLGRMKKLQRKMLKPRLNDDIEDYNIELVAVDAPFIWHPDPSTDQTQCIQHENEIVTDQQEKNLMRTWWRRNGNEYHGLEDSLVLLHNKWIEGGFEGILGFSQGSRLTYLISCLNAASHGKAFANLEYVIMASGYGDVPLPSNFPPKGSIWDDFFPNKLSIDSLDHTFLPLSIPSLHIMGVKDQLIPLQSSRALLPMFVNPIIYEHEGGHHIPMKAADTQTVLTFIDSIPKKIEILITKEATPMITKDNRLILSGANALNILCPNNNHDDGRVKLCISSDEPNEEHTQLQIDECESLALIFPEEFQLLSKRTCYTDHGGEERWKYAHPITYSIKLKPQSEQLVDDTDFPILWPAKDVALKVEYTIEYPDVKPIFTVDHKMNLLEFKISQNQALIDVINAVAESEIGMPCVMSCVGTARDFFETGGFVNNDAPLIQFENVESNVESVYDNFDNIENNRNRTKLKKCSDERKEKCKKEGMIVADTIIRCSTLKNVASPEQYFASTSDEVNKSIGKGGLWKYTIGLVGKPSAGKSTFFNAASGFARQRGSGGGNCDENGVAIGGATMAPHPFTTIDPNVGYCLVPAPKGSCPEDDKGIVLSSGIRIGCTHGRDSKGRRLLPVMLKDVAGLVPGAYQGRGKGNKFLDDLTDADVLIHVVDASGTADTEGNDVGIEEGSNKGAGSHPLNDLAWIQNELIQWLFINLEAKWDRIVRRGQDKLVDMFSGYKQSQSFVWNVLLAIENFLNKHEGRDHALDNLDAWDEGDLYRLVVAFLGARFPMALALNKIDLPSADKYIEEISNSLPLHGKRKKVKDVLR